MSKPSSNGDEIPEAAPSVLARILNRARVREAAEEQAAAKRVRDARERSRQARVRARRERKGKGT